MDMVGPDVRVTRLAKPVDELAQRVRSLDIVFRPLLGRWEADVEAFHLLLLAAVHACSCARLAIVSPSFLPTAYVTARACMESGARALWLVHPEEPFEREARWLGHLETDASARERLAKALTDPPVQNLLEETSRRIREFAAAVAARLPEGTPAAKIVPKLRPMLEAMGHPEKYLVYIQMSQATHGTHFATGAFRRHLGAFKEYGEFITADDWALPLSTCWWFLAMPLLRLGNRYAVDRETLLPHDLEARFSDAQKAIVTADRPKEGDSRQ
jgi:hypothetical protein